MIENRYPNVCVLMAAYNGEPYISEQIDSILNQRDVSVTLYVSLDLSSDKTLDILNSYGQQVVILDYGQRYGSAGKNFLRLIQEVDVTQYDYIAFADQDDIWNEDKIFRATKCIAESGCDGYSSDVMAFWENGEKKLLKKSYPQSVYDFLFESPGPGCTFVLSKPLYCSLQCYIRENKSTLELVWLHDWLIYSYARSNGFKWCIDNWPSMLYRQHGSNEVGANLSIKSMVNRFKVLLSGKGLLRVEQQAQFLLQKQVKPMVYLQQGRLGALKLMLISHKLRRAPLHKLFCFFYFFLCTFVGLTKTSEAVE